MKYLCSEEGEEFTIEAFSLQEAIEHAQLYGGVVIGPITEED